MRIFLHAVHSVGLLNVYLVRELYLEREIRSPDARCARYSAD